MRKLSGKWDSNFVVPIFQRVEPTFENFFAKFCSANNPTSWEKIFRFELGLSWGHLEENVKED